MENTLNLFFRNKIILLISIARHSDILFFLVWKFVFIVAFNIKTLSSNIINFVLFISTFIRFIKFDI